MAEDKIRELLLQYSNIVTELRTLGITRYGRVFSDYGEYVVCKKLGLKRADSSVNKGFDAVDKKGLKYEIDALEWLAAMASHVPNKGEQMVRYYGYYSNVSRGKRTKGDSDKLIPSILEPNGSSKSYRKNWARLIQKIGACPGLDPGKSIR